MVELLAQLFDQEVEFEADEVAQTIALNMIMSDRDLGTIVVASRNGKCVGMVLMLYTVSTALGGRVAILEDTVVAEGERGTGIGGKIVEAAIDIAKHEGCKRITLLADSVNVSAHRFYERIGFTRSAMVPFRLHISDD